MNNFFSKKKIEKILTQNYSKLKNIKNISNFNSSGANSIIFFFESNKIKYLLKIIPDPSKIYGNKNGQKRIEVITNIISKFSKKFKFEDFVKNDDNNFSTIYNKSVIRVTKYIKPSKSKKNLYLKSIKMLNKIHEKLSKKLSAKDKKKLMQLSVPYTLDYTFKKHKKIKNFLIREQKKNEHRINTKHLNTILKNFNFLNKLVNKIINLKKNEFYNKKTFTHNDFHQGNVVVDQKGHLNLFDFDNIQYSNKFRCLYFFLLRFAFHKKKINKKNFKKAFYFLKDNYYSKIPNYYESIEFTLYIEIEKIFKILCRVYREKCWIFLLNK